MSQTSVVWVFSDKEYEELVGRLTGHLGRLKGRRSHRPILELSDASWDGTVNRNGIRLTLPVQPGSLTRLKQIHWARRDSVLNELAGEIRRLASIHQMSPIISPRIKINYYFRTRRKRQQGDLVPEFLVDALCAAGLIENNGSRNIESCETLLKVDRERPRIEIEIKQ